MPRPSSGQTTAPARSTHVPEGGETEWQIRWVAPSPTGPITSLSKLPVVLGRDEDCDTVLLGAETSRRHAEIRKEGPVPVIRDLGSRNGIHVNRERVQEAPLDPGDVIRLGEWVGVVAEVPVVEGVPTQVHAIAPGLFGGPTLAAALAPARRVAPSGLPIIVEGETGTGKERAALAIHEWSGRGGPFLAVNCAALTETLAEGELFGYRRGAFTGADRANPGHFRAADGGTLLLDEIVDLPPSIQAKVLRVLEQREVMPLGESKPVPIDVRIVAAAQAPLGQAVTAGAFRADLFARLEGLVVTLPPLRERVEDVPFLFQEILRESSSGKVPALDPKLVEQLCLYDWPFNVRELALTARRILALQGDRDRLERRHLPERVLAGSASVPPPRAESADAPQPKVVIASRRGATADEVEALAQALRDSRGNVARAAAALGITRQRAYRLMEARLGLDPDDLREDSGASRKPS